MVEFWPALAAAVLSLVAMLAAAKTHGRHLRLEREQAGYVDVDVRRPNNPAPVEALWRQDRRGFWRLYPFFALVAGVVGGLVPADSTGVRVLLVGTGVLLWGFTLTFLVQGARSWLRLDRATDERRPNPRWWSSLHATTWAWWTATLTLWAAALFVLTLAA